MAEEVDTDVGYSKRKEEERKPRQEAVVKSITPDQPAPVVERRPAESRAATEQAAEGFLSRLFGLFRKKPAAEAPAAAAASKPKERERNDRGNRRGRGGRNRGRDKDERSESREPKEAKETKEVREPKEARQPKPQREPREAREGREPREGGEQRESRRERGRQNRDDKRNQPTEEKLSTELPVAAAAPIVATTSDEAPVQPDLLIAADEEAATEANGDQPRRRRRRGGRNRNRRDRDQAETAGAEDGSDTELMDEHHADTDNHAAEIVNQFVEHAHEPEAAQAPVVHQSVEQPSAAAAAAPEAMSAQSISHPEPTLATETASVTATEPVIAAPSAETAEAPAPAAAPVLSTSVAPTEEAAPADIVPAEPVAVVHTPAPTRPGNGATPAAARSESLEQALAAAGLMMATTDPEKLRKVQEAAASVVPAPRVPRERKPMPPVSNEPLEQVETRS